jgi:F-type H+-transporting ATPase subunit alpha
MMPNISVKELSAELRRAISDLELDEGLEKVGIVTRVGDGVAWIYGLKEAGYNEVLKIETAKGEAEAFALNLMEDEIGAVLLGDEAEVSAGAKVRLSGEVVRVPVGPELLGRVVDPLGRPLDGLGEIKTKQTGAAETQAPGVMSRQSVDQPLMTGLIAIDTMVPIGRGQRELIIGDRQTGKTAITVDTMINQAKKNTVVKNIYVAIGQKRSKITRLIEKLRSEGVMEQTTIVATSPDDPAPLLYLAPYAGAAMGEYFRDNKDHALVIYDDLSKHANAYRQM